MASCRGALLDGARCSTPTLEGMSAFERETLVWWLNHDPNVLHWATATWGPGWVQPFLLDALRARWRPREEALWSLGAMASREALGEVRRHRGVLSSKAVRAAAREAIKAIEARALVRDNGLL